jgi:hypothetical protein
MVQVIEADFKNSRLAELLRRRLPEYPKMPEKIVMTKSAEDLRELVGRDCKAACRGDTIIVSPDSGIESIIHEVIHVNHPEWGEYEVETEEERALIKFQRYEVWDRIAEKGIVFGALDLFREGLIRETIAKLLAHRRIRIGRYSSGFFQKWETWS